MTPALAAARAVVALLALSCVPAASAAPPAPLRSLGVREQQLRVEGDAGAVLRYRDGLRAVADFARARPDLFPPEGLAEGRILPRAAREEVWSAWKSYLDYLLAIDALAAYYRDFYRLPGETRGASFLVAHAAFVASYRSALDFIDLADNDPGMAVLLDEPVPELGLPARTFAGLRFRFLNVARAGELAAYAAIDRTVPRGRFAVLRTAIDDDARAIWRAGRGKGEVMTAVNALRVVRDAGTAVTFPVQAGISEWMGDTKVWRPERSLVSQAQIAAMLPRLEPGDILLERREWYLSNVGLPGYWPHAALFVGTAAQRASTLADDETRAWVRAQGEASGDLDALLRTREPAALAASLLPMEGHAARVLEAMSEGVVFTSLEHSAAADAVAVLRPRLSRRDKAQAIARAFHYAGRPYDFDFDFRTDATLVCTELVYKAYEPAAAFRGLRLPLEEILGRLALPANGIVRMFDADHGSDRAQLDLVLFLDGNEKSGAAVESDLAAFRASWRRPKWHILVAGHP